MKLILSPSMYVAPPQVRATAVLVDKHILSLHTFAVFTGFISCNPLRKDITLMISSLLPQL
jgi:hypothetical protein